MRALISCTVTQENGWLVFITAFAMLALGALTLRKIVQRWFRVQMTPLVVQ